MTKIDLWVSELLEILAMHSDLSFLLVSPTVCERS